MNRLKLFISNFLIYGLGNITAKIIPFFMLPIITRLMPEPSYFGLNELVVTFVSFGSAIAIMGMYDAVFRIFFDSEDIKFKKSVCSTALYFTMGISGIVFVLCLVLRKWLASTFFGSSDYEILVYIAAFTIFIGSTNSILGIPIRAQNQSKLFITLNLVTAMVSYLMAIPMLLNEHFIVAMPIAGALSVITRGVICYHLNRDWFSYKLFEYAKLIELLKIAIPLLPIFLIYWIFSSFDKLIISSFLGNEEVGIYSIGIKVAGISQLIYSAFAGGWQYFAFSTMNDERQVENNSRVYEYLGIISFVSTVLFCSICKPLFECLFKGDYVLGYKVAPLLFLGPLLLMLYQIAGNQFLVIKKTWPSPLILLTGGLCNIFINYTLVPVLGIRGAALANIGGYIVTNIVCDLVLLKIKLINLTKRFVFMFFLCLVILLYWTFNENNNVSTTISILILYILLSLFFYKKDLLSLIDMIHKRSD